MSELIPTRVGPLLLAFVLGLAMVAGLVGLYGWTHWLAPEHPLAKVAAFDLAAPTNFATWLSSVLFALAGVAAYVVYSVRRYRIDDYHGRYRVWLWAALCWLVLSADRVAHLRHAFRDLMVGVTGTRLYADGSIWWLAFYLFILGSIAGRLLIDARRCFPSCLLLLVTAACYITAAVNKFGVIPVQDTVQTVLIREGGVLLGSLTLFLAMALNARYVLLDATGLLPHDFYATETGWDGEQVVMLTDRSVAMHPAHPGSRQAAAMTPVVVQEVTPVPTAPVALPASSVVASTPAVLVNPPVNRRLTKEERKRLREKMDRLQQG